jgi:hypothetical protein
MVADSVSTVEQNPAYRPTRLPTPSGKVVSERRWSNPLVVNADLVEFNNSGAVRPEVQAAGAGCSDLQRTPPSPGAVVASPLAAADSVSQRVKATAWHLFSEASQDLDQHIDDLAAVDALEFVQT